MKAPSQPLSRIAIDDLGCYRSRLEGSISDLALYADRAALLPYEAVVVQGGASAPILEEHHAWLRSEYGVGARRLIFVEGEDLFDGLEANSDAAEDVRRTIGAGATIECFSPQEPWPTFRDRFKLARETVRTPDWSVARVLDNKRALREFACSIDQAHLFPHFVYAHTRTEVEDHLAELLVQYQSVWVKSEDAESGVGQLRVKRDTSTSKIKRFLDEICPSIEAEGKTIILEVHQPGFEASLQWYLPPYESGRAPQRRFMSKQYVKNGVYNGGLVTADPADIFTSLGGRTLAQDIVDTAWEVTEPFVQHVWKMGYVGAFGVDFSVMTFSDGRSTKFAIVLREVNARKTAATYIESVRWQLGVPVAAVQNMMVSPSVHEQSWRGVHECICAHTPSSECGGFPTSPRLTKKTIPWAKAQPLIYATSIEAVERMLTKLRSQLCPPEL